MFKIGENVKFIYFGLKYYSNIKSITIFKDKDYSYQINGSSLIFYKKDEDKLIFKVTDKELKKYYK